MRKPPVRHLPVVLAVSSRTVGVGSYLRRVEKSSQLITSTPTPFVTSAPPTAQIGLFTRNSPLSTTSPFRCVALLFDSLPCVPCVSSSTRMMVSSSGRATPSWSAVAVAVLAFCGLLTSGKYHDHHQHHHHHIIIANAAQCGMTNRESDPERKR